MAEIAIQPDTTAPKVCRPAVDVRRLEDDSLILRSPYDLPGPPENICVWLRRPAADAPDRLFI